ncbi:MAG: PP2C family protein-serine/threonine phosphatase [Armatimonadota bacterium]|jgi:serine phosphatase RsbU (regulator of sigma subunit)
MRTERADPVTTEPLHRLMTAIRWATFAFVFLAAWQIPFTWAAVSRLPVMITIGVIALGTLILEQAARRLPWLKSPILVLLGDVLMVSAVVYFSDGILSPFYPLYYIVVIIAAVNYGLRGALLCAVALTLISLPIDLIASASHKHGGLGTDAVRTIPYLFLTAFIAGALRERIRVLDNDALQLQTQRAANQREMEVAATIQRAQLPPEIPAVERLHIATTYKPAREVGGDLYDFYPIHSEQPGVLIADVSGKGVPAALLVSSCKYAVRENMAVDLAAMARAANESMLPITTDDMFVTMLYGRFDVSKREFTYVNAGHMPPIIVRQNGDTIFPEHSDPPLAVLVHPEYTEQALQLQPGDTVVLYTDGVTDALSSGDGINSLRNLVGRLANSDIQTWGDELINQIGEPQHLDDITMVAIKVD